MEEKYMGKGITHLHLKNIGKKWTCLLLDKFACSLGLPPKTPIDLVLARLQFGIKVACNF